MKQDATQPSPDKSANLTSLWITAQPIILSFVRSMVYRFEDAEDIVQQVAIVAAKRFDDFDHSRPFVPWALGIARNLVLRYNRDKNIHNVILVDNQLMEQITEAFTDKPSGSTEVNVALEHCISNLTDRARNLIQLRYVRDLSPRDIADRLGTSANVVSVTLNRVRTTLKNCISKRLASPGA